MVTLIRYFLLNYKRVKIKLAFYNFVDQVLTELNDDPDKVKDEFFKAFAKFIDEQNKVNDNNG